MTWSVRDRWGNEIILTDERWQHITDGHWELATLLEQVLETLRLRRRKQFPDDSTKYRYSHSFSNLPRGYMHLFVIVRMASNKFVITAYPKGVR